MAIKGTADAQLSDGGDGKRYTLATNAAAVGFSPDTLGAGKGGADGVVLYGWCQ